MVAHNHRIFPSEAREVLKVTLEVYNSEDMYVATQDLKMALKNQAVTI